MAELEKEGSERATSPVVGLTARAVTLPSSRAVATRAGTAVEGGEDRGPGVGGVVQPLPGHGEQQGPVDVVGAQRLRAQPPSVGHLGLGLRAPGLGERRRRGDDGDSEEHGDGRETGAQPLVGPALEPQVLLRGPLLPHGQGGRCVEEGSLRLAEAGLGAALPLLRPCLPDPTVELALGPTQVGPALGGHRQVSHGPQPLDVVVQPGPEAWPGTDECLVGHLEAVVVRSDETGLHQALDEVCMARTRGEVAARDVGPHRVPVVVQHDQPHHQLSQRLLLLGGQGPDDLFGRLRHGFPDAAGPLVALDRERRSLAAFPGLAQDVREEGQRPRLALHLADEEVDEPGLEAQPGLFGGAFDRSSQVGWGHRRQQVEALFHPTGEGRVRRQVAHPVGAEGDDEGSPGRVLEEGLEERFALPVVARPDEGLLALVDDEHRGCRRRGIRERRHGVPSGRDDDDLVPVAGEGRGDPRPGQ